MITESEAAPGFMYKFGRGLIRPYLRMRYRPKVVGVENIPATGPVLLVSNHLSSLDTVLIPSFASRQVHFLAKASLFNTKFKNYVMRGIGAIPIYREASQAAGEALKVGKDVLMSGKVFAVFPEGSRSKTGKLNKGRAGAAWLALETGAKVIPIGIKGTNRKQASKGTSNDKRIELRIGEEVKLGDLRELPGGKARAEATKRIMSAIASLSGQERSTEYASGGRGE